MMPPLNVTPEQIDTAARQLTQAFREVEAHFDGEPDPAAAQLRAVDAELDAAAATDG